MGKSQFTVAITENNSSIDEFNSMQLMEIKSDLNDGVQLDTWSSSVHNCEMLMYPS